MHTISIRQPWAWLIVNGHKDIENRSWQTGVRGKVLIHASGQYNKKTHKEMELYIFEQYGIELPPFEKMHTGGIVGSVEIVNCVRRHSSPWKEPSSFGFVMDKAEVLPFKRLSGKLGFFHAHHS